MIGLKKFTESFKNFTDSYIVIGGAACEDYFEREGISFRVTKDIDMILVVEAVDDEFIAYFWDFIKEGNYERNEQSEERQYYRFINPVKKDFPVQLELFSRTPDIITLDDDIRFTIIPTDEDLSSLSAILMDDDYYRFTLDNCTTEGALKRATELALVCLKAKAFLDLSQRKDEGQRIDSKTIKKHRSDVFRLAATLTGEDQIELPESIQKDMDAFVRIMETNPPQTKDFLKAMGITMVSTEQLIDQLKSSFKFNK
ncbi:MAG TPA: hypothetical protein VE912_11515 [Bacteroidales bacterium]|nr:hypothetical protein [Bacteroidales bacterium]